MFKSVLKWFSIPALGLGLLFVVNGGPALHARATEAFQGFGNENHVITHATEADLQREYDALNAEYYESRLPQATLSFASNLKGMDDAGNMVPAEAVTFPGEYPRIRIDSEFKNYPSVAFELVIHEQCHVSTDKFHPEFDQHGPNFQKCMLRMAEAGALKELW